MNLTDQNQFTLQAHTNAIQAATESLVTALNRAHAFVWGLPDSDLINLLTAMGPARVQALMGNHFILATASNTALEAAGSESRAIAVAGREISFDETAWTIIPLSQPDPAVEQ